MPYPVYRGPGLSSHAPTTAGPPSPAPRAAPRAPDFEAERQPRELAGEPEEVVGLAAQEHTPPGVAFEEPAAGKSARRAVSRSVSGAPRRRVAAREGGERVGDVGERVEIGRPGEGAFERRTAAHAVEAEGAQAVAQVAVADDVPAAAAVGEAVGIEVALGLAVLAAVVRCARVSGSAPRRSARPARRCRRAGRAGEVERAPSRRSRAPAASDARASRARASPARSRRRAPRRRGRGRGPPAGRPRGPAPRRR